MEPRPQRVVIVGGGFAGLYCARALARAPIAVTLLDRRNHHLFQPLLYQVATAALNTGDIAAPIRSVFRKQANTQVLLGEVAALDLEGRHVQIVGDGALEYDHLVLATGVTHSYFGHEEWASAAPGLKTIEDALEIRRRIFTAFEEAEREQDEAARTALLTFVIVGGGPTGVELAGALAEIARHTLAREFRHIDPARTRIVLVEGMPRVLPTYPDDLSASARRQLEQLGVEVRTDARVTAIDAAGVTAGEARIPSRTVLWGAGVAASPLGRALGVPLDRAGRVRVNPDLSVPGRPGMWVAGDLAAATGEDGSTVPGIAPAAIQMGEHVARNILRASRGEPSLPFRYRDKGYLATIGRARAVGVVGRWHLSGLPAWLAWLFVHLYFLIGFKNRVMVLLQWAWAYVTFKRGARLITDTALRWRLAAETSGRETGSRSPPPSEAETDARLH
jgi:NADH dehydrogenase